MFYEYQTFFVFWSLFVMRNWTFARAARMERVLLVEAKEDDHVKTLVDINLCEICKCMFSRHSTVIVRQIVVTCSRGWTRDAAIAFLGAKCESQRLRLVRLFGRLCIVVEVSKTMAQSFGVRLLPPL